MVSAGCSESLEQAFVLGPFVEKLVDMANQYGTNNIQAIVARAIKGPM